MINLKELCRKNGIFQKDLAKELNISAASVTKWALGQTEPDIETLKRLADYFNVSTDYLLGVTDDPTPTVKPLNIPEEIKNVKFAFSGGDTEDLTPDEVDKINEYIKFVRSQRSGKNDKT